MQLNMNDLDNGIYFLEFRVNKLSFSKKVIIQR